MVKEEVINYGGLDAILDDEIEKDENDHSAPPNILARLKRYLWSKAYVAIRKGPKHGSLA